LSDFFTATDNDEMLAGSRAVGACAFPWLALPRAAPRAPPGARCLHASRASLVDPEPRILRFKPITPGLRHVRVSNTSHLFKGHPILHLSKPLQRDSGKNPHTGRRMVRGRGGGVKKILRLVDHHRLNTNPHEVLRLELDGFNRSAWLALTRDKVSGELSYIVAYQGIEVGDEISSHPDAPVKLGNHVPLSRIPVGTLVHNIELYPTPAWVRAPNDIVESDKLYNLRREKKIVMKYGGQLCRAAGTFGQVLRTGPTGKAIVKVPSGELMEIPVDAKATIGAVSNPQHHLTQLGKAGRSRWIGRRSKTRGVAMNPVDHPLGGGNGKGKRGKPSFSYWGFQTKGKIYTKYRRSGRPKPKPLPRKKRVRNG
jgi:ribosomal protein L2